MKDIGLIVTALLLSVCMQSTTSRPNIDDRAVRGVKRTLVSGLETGLPEEALENWLRRIMPAGWKIAWSVGDCDEKWDFAEPPEGYRLCVRAYSFSTGGDDASAKLLIHVGTTRRGLLRQPKFHQLLVDPQLDNKSTLKLSELPDWVRAR